MGKSNSKLSVESLEKLKLHHHQHHHSGDEHGACSCNSDGGLGGARGPPGAGSGSLLASPSSPFPRSRPTIGCSDHTKHLRKGLSLDQMPADAQLNGILYDEKTFVKFLTDIFDQEVELTDSMQTLFRGNCAASKIMSHCFRTFGIDYLRKLLGPHIPHSTPPTAIVSYEIDLAKLEEDGDMDLNQKNLLKLTKQILDSILASAVDFPPQLNLMCICLRKVLCKRYPNSDTYLKAVGTVIFLRFINPAIVSPCESGIIEKQPPPRIMRGLMLVSKILQNIANNVEFSKEEHMLPFNDFVRTQFDPMRKWVAQISSEQIRPPNTCMIAT